MAGQRPFGNIEQLLTGCGKLRASQLIDHALRELGDVEEHLAKIEEGDKNQD